MNNLILRYHEKKCFRAFCQIRERMRERLAEEMNAPEERINYLKSIEL